MELFVTRGLIFSVVIGHAAGSDEGNSPELDNATHRSCKKKFVIFRLLTPCKIRIHWPKSTNFDTVDKSQFNQPVAFRFITAPSSGTTYSMLRNKTRCGLSLRFVYPNFTHCFYVFHTFTVGLATLAICYCIYAVIVECLKLGYTKCNEKAQRVLFRNKKYLVPDDGAVMNRNATDCLNRD